MAPFSHKDPKDTDDESNNDGSDDHSSCQSSPGGGGGGDDVESYASAPAHLPNNTGSPTLAIEDIDKSDIEKATWCPTILGEYFFLPLPIQVFLSHNISSHTPTSLKAFPPGRYCQRGGCTRVRTFPRVHACPYAQFQPCRPGADREAFCF